MQLKILKIENKFNFLTSLVWEDVVKCTVEDMGTEKSQLKFIRKKQFNSERKK